ncbi:MAG TPA: HEAT repeat domain-containing protein [Gemmatimonadaceae bacterium]|nr:HEAT repeat domain-containing protein [Gemmatimonadaceae bacterium]
MHTSVLAVRVAALAIGFATPLAAQSLASRVAQAPDGAVRMQIDSRMGVCGNGRDVVGYRSAIFAHNFQSIGGHWNDSRCVPGPLRVTLTVADGQVTQVRTQVGGAWPDSESRVTDLGVVPPHEASSYFFSLVPRLESASGKDRLLLPAVLADGAPVIQPLLALARDEQRAEHTRRQAILWLGLLGDASVIPALVQFARDEPDDDVDDRRKSKPRKKDLGSAAMAALNALDGDVGVPALIDLARSGSVGTRRDAAFWLGQNGSESARRTLHAMIENTSEASRVRSHAVFALTHGGDTPDAEFDYLRNLYPRLDDNDVKEAIIQGMQEDEGAGGRWLIDRALDEREPSELRRKAIFWAGQREATPTSELVRVYREADDRELREHAIFVLSQRDEEAAIDELLRIARDDRDTEMRSKALFWLAQKDDPRIRKLIADLVLK